MWNYFVVHEYYLFFFPLSANFYPSFSHSSVITSSGKPSLIALPMTNLQLYTLMAPHIYYLLNVIALNFSCSVCEIT